MVEKNNILNDLEADLQELTNFYEQASRLHVKYLLEKEINKIKDLVLIEKNKVVQKAEEVKEKTLVSEYLEPNEESLVYIPIKSYSWEQENKIVKVYITLDGIGDVEKNNISCIFEDQGFDLKIKGFKSQNMRFAIKKLGDAISKETCKFVVKKNSIHLTLSKKDGKHWDNLYFKESQVKLDKPEISEKEDPQASLMNMMKKLYQEGDDEMKKTIAQAWTKSQDEKEKKK